MAGQSQAANLTGMLSQIGATIGSMGSAGDGLLSPIKQSFRPDLDPNDPESLRKAAAYQTGVGETEAGRLYAAQAQELAEKQRREQEQTRQGVVARQMATLRQAVQQGELTPEQFAAAEEGLIANATEAGMNPAALVGFVDKTKNEYLAAKDAQLARDFRAKAAKDEQAIQSLSAGLAAVDTSDSKALEQFIKNAGEYSAEAQQLVSRQLQINNQLSTVREQQKTMATPLDLSGVEAQLEQLPDEFRKTLQPRVDALKKTQEQGFVNGGWKTLAHRTSAAKQANALLNQIGTAAMSNASQEVTAARRQESDKLEKVERLRLQKLAPLDSGEVNARARVLFGRDEDGDVRAITPEDLDKAEAVLRQERSMGIDDQIRFLTGESEEVPDVPESDGGFSVKAPDGNVITRDYAMRAKKAGRTAKQLADATGISLEQAEVLMGRPVQSSKRTQEQMITEPGLINPLRARQKLQQNSIFN